MYRFRTAYSDQRDMTNGGTELHSNASNSLRGRHIDDCSLPSKTNVV